MNKITLTAGIVAAMTLSACTDPGRTTAVGAATGGVLGAGLGAIVGNQTGDPGSGLLIGAVAGTSAGAMVGNALQSQQEAIQSQDEALERQQQIIKAQRAELEELRRGGSDYPVTAGSPVDIGSLSLRSWESRPRSPSDAVAFNRTLQPSIRPVARIPDTTVAPSRPSSSLNERDLIEGTTPETPAIANDMGAPLVVVENSATLGAVDGTDRGALAWKAEAPTEAPAGNDDCRRAEAEVSQAEQVKEAPDKLFHFRRALRLCPNNAVYHNKLGELYLSLNRRADAQFEFREAMTLDPNFELARENLRAAQ